MFLDLIRCTSLFWIAWQCHIGVAKYGLQLKRLSSWRRYIDTKKSEGDNCNFWLRILSYFKECCLCKSEGERCRRSTKGAHRRLSHWGKGGIGWGHALTADVMVQPEEDPPKKTIIPDQFLPTRPTEEDLKRTKQKKTLEDTLMSTTSGSKKTSYGFPSSYQLQFEVPKGGANVDRKHFMIRDSVTEFRELQLRQKGINGRSAKKE